MITTYIVLFISLWIHGYRSQCAKEKPFYMIDRQCTNFNDICVKKDSGPCKSLLQACAQCPDSNLTESTLVNMLTILRDQRNKTTETNYKLEGNYKNFEARFNKSESEILEKLALVEKRSSSSTCMVIIIIAICVIGFLVILLVLIEMRFQPFRASRNYEKIPMTTNHRFDETIHQTLADIQEQIKEIMKTLSGTPAPSEQKNGDLPTNNSITASINMQGFTNPIKIQINRDDNTVKIKQKICAKMVNTKSYHFKMMVLKLNGTPLDDNEYLADKICSADNSLHCDVIENLNQNEIVVVMLRGNISLPEMIQFNRFQSIEWLKSVLSQLTGVAADSLKLFRDSNEINKLDDLKDFESLRVIERHTGQITIKSIFDNIKEVPLSYSNVESIGNIKKKIADSLGCPAENVILFCGNKNLNDDIFVFEIDIEQLQFCHLIPTEKVETTKYVMHGDFSEIFEGRNPGMKEEVVLKKYQLETMKILKENKAFLNELITFQITKSHGGFVHLNGVFKENDYFYISMEKMEGSIKPYITKDPLLLEETIVKWAKQILSALKYLHDHLIIHRNIKPSSILLDKDGNIKLSSFGVAKYVRWGDKKYLMEGFEQSRPGTFRYMAPEVCHNENCGAQTDVWSFGATMIEMATGIQPFDGKTESKALMEIGKTKRIPFELDQTRSPEIKKFIDRCLIANPKNRATVDELLNHDFLHPK